MQAFSNVLGDEQLAIAKTVVQEDNENTAETGRILNQTTMKKAVSTLTIIFMLAHIIKILLGISELVLLGQTYKHSFAQVTYNKCFVLPYLCNYVNFSKSISLRLKDSEHGIENVRSSLH